MTSLAKVPCTIVTGFLGAGKTTLVRHVLENADGRRLAFMVSWTRSDAGPLVCAASELPDGARVRRVALVPDQRTGEMVYGVYHHSPGSPDEPHGWGVTYCAQLP